MAISKDEILEAIGSMSVLDLSELIKEMEEKFGVSAAAAAVAMPAAGGAAGGEAAAEEKITIEFAFATVVAIKAIKKGDKFTKENLWVKRPGTGEILAEKYNEIIGKVAANDVQDDNHLKWKDIE